ncbi:hypothetical protein HAX54_015911 [Datura stramonium]|uniref:Uncharacterized protein n=1 Tax=Datura stramonium TaxID=4076 RepID=A0ABS8UK96_DATST|nr:hypothetical protein [Datura stramonium]
MNFSPIIDVGANSNDSHDDDFEDSDYTPEEDDILFSKNVDLSAESFGINIHGKKKKNDGKQDYVIDDMQRRMQNKEGDSDCVDSNDTKSLNSDCDSKNKDL